MELDKKGNTLQLKTETKVGLFVLMAIGLFAYMSLYLGVFRLYVKNHNFYHLYFEDLSGLEKKADVKIAGVKVGWIDNVQLIENGTQAKVSASIKSDYVIYNDAHAEIKQETLLGNKYLEIFPGDPRTGIVHSGENFGRKVESLVSIERLIKKFDNIATNIEDLSYSLKNVLGTQGQQEQLRSIISNINDASVKIAVFTDVLSRNERNIDLLINNLQKFSQNIVPVGNEINRVTTQLYMDVLPSFQSSIQRISDIFDRDFNRVATRLDSTMVHYQSVAKKIDDGDGLLGKLVNGFWRKKKKKNIAKPQKKTSDTDLLISESEIISPVETEK